MFLTAGIALGSWWAYYELGWGGWWFWDPVENASFIPWLFGTALLHSSIVVEKRDALKSWTILLAILTFSMSLLGTFLVRSGILTSVHAFATDPERGVFILAILAVAIGGALTLFAVRAPGMKGGGLFAPASREGALVANNMLLTVAAATVLLGTLYPLILEALSGGQTRVSVGPPFFNAFCVTFLSPQPPAFLDAFRAASLEIDLGCSLGRRPVSVRLAIIGFVLCRVSTGRGHFVLASSGKGGTVFRRLGFRQLGWLIAANRLVFRSLGGDSVIAINDRSNCCCGAHFSLTATLRIHRDRHE